MQNVEWTNRTSLELIRQYREQPVLWNTRHGYHYSKLKRQEAWDTIACNMDIGVDDVRQKMNSLLGSFRRERSKMRRGEGRYAAGSFPSRWFAFESMVFLLDRNEEISNDKVYLDELQVKLEEDQDEDLALDSDSNHLLEEELNEASRETTSDSKKHEERLSTNLIQLPTAKKIKMRHNSGLRMEDNFAQDECGLYGQYLASKLRKFSSKARARVEHAISNILFEADLGKYDDQRSEWDNKRHSPNADLLSPDLDGISLFPPVSDSPEPIPLPLCTEITETISDGINNE